MTNTRATAGAVTLALTAAAAMFFFTSSRASAVDQTGDLDVACGESHRAVVRQVRNGSSTRISVDCVTSGVVAASSLNGAVPLTTAYYPEVVSDSRMVPVAYVSQATAAPVVQAVAPARSTAPRAATATRASQRPSWQKRAIIIGASAGAGAGVGALIGGKKGALIGAAAGGGGAAVVDQIRNR